MRLALLSVLLLVAAAAAQSDVLSDTNTPVVNRPLQGPGRLPKPPTISDPTQNPTDTNKQPETPAAKLAISERLKMVKKPPAAPDPAKAKQRLPDAYQTNIDRMIAIVAASAYEIENPQKFRLVNEDDEQLKHMQEEYGRRWFSKNTPARFAEMLTLIESQQTHFKCTSL